MAKAFGYESGRDVVGLSIFDFPSGLSAPQIATDCSYVFQNGQSIEGERKCTDAHGNRVVYSTKKVPLKDYSKNTKNKQQER